MAAKLWPVLRIAAGLLFVASGFEKLTGPHQNFQYVIEQYHVLGTEDAELVALALPWVELVAGAFFALGLWTAASGIAILAMLAVFIVAVGQALVRGLPLGECGCFGELISLPLPAVLAMDTALFALVAAGLRRRPGVRAASLDARL